MAQNYDYIICLTGSKIKDYNPQNNQKSTHSEISAMLQNDAENIDPIGQLIELSYCAYDVNKQVVQNNHEGSFLIKGQNFESISQIQLDHCRISLDKYKAGSINIKEALQQLNDFIYQTFIRESKSFCFMTYGDDLLTRIIPLCIREELNMKLAPHFFQYFDVTTEFKKHLPHAVQLYSLSEMLQYTNLKSRDNSFEPFAQATCKSVVRLLNMLITEGHILANPKMINSNFKAVIDSNDKQGAYISQRQQKSKKNYVRARSPSPFKNPTRGYYLRLRGFPLDSTEYEVFDFMRGIRLYKEDIGFNFDSQGKFTGEIYIRLVSESDKFEAMNFNLGEVDNNLIEIFETTENDWNISKMSQFSDKKDSYQLNAEPTNASTLVSDEQGIVKVKGISQNTTEQDIISLFVGLKVAQVRRAVVGGKAGQECFVVFQSKAEAHQAIMYHMEKLNSRFIEVFLATKQDFDNYMAHNFANSAPTYSKDNMPVIAQEKRKSTLMIMGLPFNVTKPQLVDFFNEYDIKERDIYVLSSHSGKFSGNVLITFEDELEAQRALKQKNFTYMRNRYIEMFEYKS